VPETIHNYVTSDRAVAVLDATIFYAPVLDVNNLSVLENS